MARVNFSSNIRNGIRFLLALPIYTKLLCVTITLCSTFNWLIMWYYNFENSLFALAPGSFIFRPWTFLTYSLIEKNVLTLMGTLIGVAACGQMFEPQWGKAEMFRFFLVVSILPGFTYCLFYITVFAFTGDMTYLTERHALGLASLISGFIIALKQTYPEYKVKLFGVKGFKLKQFPSVVLSIITILGLLLAPFTPDMILAWHASFVAWIYLRFYKAQDGIKGDRSETFSFVSFFPTILRPPVKVISNGLFSLLVRLRLCRPIHTISSNDLESGLYYVPAPTQNRSPIHSANPAIDSERRKALALKALDERLRLSSPSEAIGSSGSLISPRPSEKSTPPTSSKTQE